MKKRVSAVRWKWKPKYCNLQKVKKSTKPTHYKKLVLSNTDPGVLASRFEDGRDLPSTTTGCDATS